jgi:hypothetical protein
MHVKLIRRLGQNRPGTIIDVTADEVVWLVARGLGENIGQDDDDPGDGDQDDDDPGEENAAGWSLAELRAQADMRGLPSYGTKAAIAERIAEYDRVRRSP